MGQRSCFGMMFGAEINRASLTSARMKEASAGSGPLQWQTTPLEHIFLEKAE